MGRQSIRERLRESELQVAARVRRVAEQRGRVERLERGRRDASEARRLLAIFETKLAVDIAHRDRLVREVRGFRSRRKSRKRDARGQIADDQD